MSERLSRIEEMHALANEAYDKGSMEKSKEILEQLFVEEDTDWLIEQTKELHGTDVHYGFKDMYAKCNRDYAELMMKNRQLNNRTEQLESENERLVKATEKWAYQYDELKARIQAVDKENERLRKRIESIKIAAEGVLRGVNN